MVADEWRDEVGEARAQVEELKDVRCFPLISDVGNATRVFVRARRRWELEDARMKSKGGSGCENKMSTMMKRS